jgi:Thioester domain
MRKTLFSCVAALLLLSTHIVSAGQITDLQFADGTSGAPTATIYYTGANGSGRNSAYVYADPQVSFGTTTPLYYCVDLWHENQVGATYTINQASSMAFANSTFADVDYRIGWLLSQDQSTPDARAAVQLAIWYTIDDKPNQSLAGFSMSTSDPTITALYNNLVSFTGYNLGVGYGAEFWQATHNPSNTLNQDLASDPPPGTVLTNSVAVPEPGSLVLSFISVLFMVGLHFWRRGV